MYIELNNQITKYFSIMDFFIGPESITQIINTSSAPHLFNESLLHKLTLMVEMETRQILESACKFMSKDRRDILQPDDVYQAVRDNGHHDLSIEYMASSGRDQYFAIQDEDFKQEILNLENLQIQESCLNGRWVYIKGKIPTLDYNIELKCLTQLEDNQHKKAILKVIKDDPLSLLTNQQAEYFQMMSQAIRKDVNPRGDFTVDGDLNSILPFFLKFLGEEAINSTGVCFLLKLIDNKYIRPAIEYNLKQVLALLLAYRGEYSFEVGIKIADFVQKFECKYPKFRDIFVGYKDDSYSTILKQIPMELLLGIALPIDFHLLERCKEDSKKGDGMAKRLMQALLFHSSELKYMRELLAQKMRTFIYWHPCTALKADPFLSTL